VFEAASKQSWRYPIPLEFTWICATGATGGVSKLCNKHVTNGESEGMGRGVPSGALTLVGGAWDSATSTLCDEVSKRLMPRGLASTHGQVAATWSVAGPLPQLPVLGAGPVGIPTGNLHASASMPCGGVSKRLRVAACLDYT